MNTPLFMGKVHVIGGGGTGSWLVPSLCKLIGPSHVIVHDGDKLESKNMDRQFFKPQHLGRNKAQALAELYGCGYRDKYFSVGACEFSMTDFIICCADNDPARLACIQAADRDGALVIIAANEKHSAEAYYYDADTMLDTEIDPRVYYPNIRTNHADDPRAAAIGCTGEAQEQSPQLVSANFMAASLAQWLFVLWGIISLQLNCETQARLPYHLIANMSNLEIKRMVITEKDSEHEPK